MSQFQDWTPVVLQKTSPGGGKRVSKEAEVNKARRAGEVIETEKKCKQRPQPFRGLEAGEIGIKAWLMIPTSAH